MRRVIPAETPQLWEVRASISVISLYFLELVSAGTPHWPKTCPLKHHSNRPLKHHSKHIIRKHINTCSSPHTSVEKPRYQALANARAKAECADALNLFFFVTVPLVLKFSPKPTPYNRTLDRANADKHQYQQSKGAGLPHTPSLSQTGRNTIRCAPLKKGADMREGHPIALSRKSTSRAGAPKKKDRTM
jgi:hypothetical protein